MPVVYPTPPMPQHLQATPATTRTKTESLHSHTISENSLLPKAVLTLKYQISVSVPQVIRVPQQKSTLKTGQIS